MIWLVVFIVITLLIFGDAAFLGYIALGIILIAAPFLVFFIVWGASVVMANQIHQQLTPLGVMIGFVAGVLAARKLVQRIFGSV
jgi:hypothetical protein